MPALLDSASHREAAPADLAAFVSSLHPARLAASLDAALSAATLARLQNSSRMRDRLARLVLGDADVAGPAPLFGQPARRAALFAGSIWHARSLLKLISGQDLGVFVDKLGAEFQPFGVRHIGLAVSTALIVDPEQLSEAVEQDGLGCLGGWLATLPERERQRVLLSLPPGSAAEQPSAAHRAAADAIFAVVLTQLALQVPQP
jgi:hypothetical protein